MNTQTRTREFKPVTTSLYEAVGIKVNELMFKSRVSRKELGEVLGITGAGMSRKIYGQSAWSLQDLYLVADFFGVEVADLLPRRIEKAPEEETSSGAVVAGAGFEPTTSGL